MTMIASARTYWACGVVRRDNLLRNSDAATQKKEAVKIRFFRNRGRQPAFVSHRNSNSDLLASALTVCSRISLALFQSSRNDFQYAIFRQGLAGRRLQREAALIVQIPIQQEYGGIAAEHRSSG